MGERYINAKTPINFEVAILFAPRLFISCGSPANGISYTHQLGHDEFGIQTSGVSHLSIYSLDQTGNARLSVSLVGCRFLFRRRVLMANCYEMLQEWEDPDCA